MAQHATCPIQLIGLQLNLRKRTLFTHLSLLVGSFSASMALSALIAENATITPVDGGGDYITSGYLLVGGDGKVQAVGLGPPPL